MQKQIAQQIGVGERDRPGGLNRHTFVIQVHAEGPSTLENLRTRERVAISDLSTVGRQIERWLDLDGISLRSGPP